MDDQEAAVAPETGPSGTSRAQEILIRFANGHEDGLREAREGILAGLDEYVRSQVLFRDHMVEAERYYLVEAL